MPARGVAPLHLYLGYTRSDRPFFEIDEELLKDGPSTFRIHRDLSAIKIFHSAGQPARSGHAAGEGSVAHSLDTTTHQDSRAHRFADFGHRQYVLNARVLAQSDFPA